MNCLQKKIKKDLQAELLTKEKELEEKNQKLVSLNEDNNKKLDKILNKVFVSI